MNGALLAGWSVAIVTIGTAAAVIGPHSALAHGGHSICAAGHRHDWENRKIPCRFDEYIFHDGPLPLRKERRKRMHHKQESTHR